MQQAQALEAQLAEATALAARLHQINEELSARLQMLEQQQAALVVAPQETVAQAMEIDVPEQSAPEADEEDTTMVQLHTEVFVTPLINMHGCKSMYRVTAGYLHALQRSQLLSFLQVKEAEPTEAPAILSPQAATPVTVAAPAELQPSAAKTATKTVNTPSAAAGTPLTGSAVAVTANLGGQSVDGKTPAGTATLPADVIVGRTPTGAPSAAATSADGSAPSARAGRPSITGSLAKLDFEGLSQALSQGSLEWVDGLILPPGSSQEAAPAPAAETPAGGATRSRFQHNQCLPGGACLDACFLRERMHLNNCLWRRSR